jgi:hypothetical protein
MAVGSCQQLSELAGVEVVSPRFDGARRDAWRSGKGSDVAMHCPIAEGIG